MRLFCSSMLLVCVQGAAASCFSVDLSISTGISWAHATTHRSDRRKVDFVSAISNLRKALAQISWDTNVFLAGTDMSFASALGCPASFGRTIDVGGIAPGHVQNYKTQQASIEGAERKITAQYKKYYDALVAAFPKSDGWSVTPFRGVQIEKANPTQADHDENGQNETYVDPTRSLKFRSAVLTHEDYSDLKLVALTGSSQHSQGSEYFEIPENYFAAIDILHSKLTRTYTRGVDFLSDQWLKYLAKEPSTSTSKKPGVMFGVGVTFSRVVFPKPESTFGAYWGAETFFESTPGACKSKGVEVKENAVGIRPMFGIQATGKWTIYALTGARYSFKKVTYGAETANKKKFEFEIGLGTNYHITEKVSVGVKVIRTLKSSAKLETAKIDLKSTKVLLCVNYKLN